MKHTIIVNFLLTIILIPLLSCATNKSQNLEYSIEDAVFFLAGEINSKAINDGTIAVLNVSTSQEELSSQIITWMENNLLKMGNHRIVSRQKIDPILKEQNFGLSGYISDDTAQSIGKMVGANYVLAGDITNVNGVHYLNMQVLETETAVLIYSNSYRIKKTELGTSKQKQKAFRF